jgi:hypothetical protein
MSGARNVRTIRDIKENSAMARRKEEQTKWEWM